MSASGRVLKSVMSASVVFGTMASGQTCDESPGPLVYDQKFGTRGPLDTVYAVHPHDGVVYFGGVFDTVAPKDASDPNFSSNGLAYWDDSAREWYDGSSGLPSGACVLALEEYDGQFYCAYQIDLVDEVYVAALSSGSWSTVWTSPYEPDIFTVESTNLQAAGSYLFLSGYTGGATPGSVARFDGSSWTTMAPNDNIYLDLAVYTIGGTDYLVHGNEGDSLSTFQGTAGFFNTSTQTAWQDWSGCMGHEELSITGDSIVEFQGVLYVGGVSNLIPNCTSASIFYSDTSLSMWNEIASGPAADPNVSSTSMLSALDLGDCEWLVVGCASAASSYTGWSYDGSTWELIGLGTTDTPPYVHDAHQVDGWLYVVGGAFGELQETPGSCSSCSINPPRVARLRAIADWNGNGLVQANDKLAFNLAKAGNAPIADLNCDGAWDSDDSDIFIGYWNACQP